MAKINIGTNVTDKRRVLLDIDICMTTRLLITADSGGGKTVLLKRLIEQAFGKVGIIVIDPEGEFAPLRTKFDFFLVGKGGDTPADIRTAEKVARTLLQGRASAVCDIYEMAASERHMWVERFLNALLDAPKELRHPYLVIVDEAHMFAPEHGKGDSVAADAMKGLATRGRKRMLCGIFATQRLATLAKDLTGMCLNRLIGPTFESINQQRAALELGIPKGAEQTAFFQKIKMLDPGYFYAIGRAVTKDLELVHIGPIETPHGQEALRYELKPPPPTEKVREWLAKLGDLPKQAEEEARTVADFKKQIRELKTKLRDSPKGTREVAVADPKAIERAMRPLREALRDAMKIIVRVEAIGEMANLKDEDTAKLLEAVRREVRRLADDKLMARDTELKAIRREAARVLARAKELLADTEEKIRLDVRVGAPEVSGEEIQQRRAVPTTKILARPRPEVPSNGDVHLTGPEKRILLALGELAAIGKDEPPSAMCAAWAQYSPIGGAFGNPKGKLNSVGLIRYPAPGTMALTDAGREMLPALGFEGPPDLAGVKRRIEAICTGPEWKILSALLAHGPDPISKDELAERSGYAPVGGAFGNPVGALRTKGLLDYPRPGQVQAADWLFEEF